MLRDKVNDHHAMLYGNGREGVLDFIAGLKAQQRLMMALLTLLITIATVVGVLIAFMAMGMQKQSELPRPASSARGSLVTKVPRRGLDAAL